MTNQEGKILLVEDNCPGYLSYPFDILGISKQISSQVGPVDR
jgi:hypothetical protein